MRLSGNSTVPTFGWGLFKTVPSGKANPCLNPSSFGWGGKRLGIERGSGAPFHPTALTDSQPQIYGSWRAHGNSARWPATFCHILGRCSECRDKCEPSHSRGSRFYKRHKTSSRQAVLWVRANTGRSGYTSDFGSCRLRLALISWIWNITAAPHERLKKPLFLNWKAQDGCTQQLSWNQA